MAMLVIKALNSLEPRINVQAIEGVTPLLPSRGEVWV
jgi:hypothetical protein